MDKLSLSPQVSYVQSAPHEEWKFSYQPGLSTGVLKGTRERRDVESFWKLNHSPGMWGATVIFISTKAGSGPGRDAL